jgi:prepilin-type N-terminal cleavage/methylation domain-containing protein
MRSASSGRDERGFTLIELMIVVAIIAILAAVAVPFFMGEARKTRSDSEVSAMFSELATKQEEYKLDNGTYLAVPACPASPSSQPQDITSCKTSASWLALRILPTESKLRCSYEVTIGAAGVDPAPPAGFTLPTGPANGWYFILATCDMDNSSTLNGQFLQSSLDASIQKVNAGH